MDRHQLLRSSDLLNRWKRVRRNLFPRTTQINAGRFDWDIKDTPIIDFEHPKITFTSKWKHRQQSN